MQMAGSIRATEKQPRRSRDSFHFAFFLRQTGETGPSGGPEDATTFKYGRSARLTTPLTVRMIFSTALPCSRNGPLRTGKSFLRQFRKEHNAVLKSWRIRNSSGPFFEISIIFQQNVLTHTRAPRPCPVKDAVSLGGLLSDGSHLLITVEFINNILETSAEGTRSKRNCDGLEIFTKYRRANASFRKYSQYFSVRFQVRPGNNL